MSGNDVVRQNKKKFVTNIASIGYVLDDQKIVTYS